MAHLEDIRRTVISDWPVDRWVAVRMVVAVSGGLDSIALLRVLSSLHDEFGQQNTGRDSRKNLVVAHFNHKTRGKDSDNDEAFVRSVCKDLSIKFVSGSRPVDLVANSEESLRSARYRFLEQTAFREQARYIATGHHADDQIETVLFRIIRGTGLSGLAGIPKFRQLNQHLSLVRPLLKIPRAKLVTLLKELGQPFREDPSNETTDYSRNFLRQQVLPLLCQKFEPHLPDSLLRLADQADELNSFLDQACQPLLEQVRFPATGQVEFNSDVLASQHPTMIKAVLHRIWRQTKWPQQAMSSHWWNQVSDAIVASQEVSLNLPANVRFRIRQNCVTIDRENRTRNEES